MSSERGDREHKGNFQGARGCCGNPVPVDSSGVAVSI